MIEVLRKCRTEGVIEGFEAVLNGTTNFVLCQMAKGVSLMDALQAARAAGFAEEDASFDLSGRDALAKLGILAREAFGCDLPPDVPRDELEDGDWSSCRCFRQIARCFFSEGDLRAEVRLEEVLPGSPFFELRGERNMIVVHMADGTKRIVRGRGAGRWPTTESLYADLVDLRSLIEG
jgi:homoserine dehydrogenase